MAEQKLNPVENAKSQKKRIILFVSLSLASVVLCTAVVIGVALSLITEGVYEFKEPERPSMTALPENDADTVSFLSSLLAQACDDKTVCVNTYTELSVDDESVKYSGSAEERSILLYAKSGILESVDKLYPEDYEGTFSDGFTAYPRLNLACGEYTSAVCTKGKLNDNGEIEDEDYYFFKVIAPGGEYPAKADTGVYESFALSDKAELAQKVRQELEAVADIVSVNVAPKDFELEAKSDRFTDKIITAEYKRQYHIAITIAFKDDLASLGTGTLEFDFSAKTKYEYRWSGIAFLSDSMTLAPGESAELAVNAVMNDYSEYSVSFTSSDESVASVDEMGYVTAHKASLEPVIITVNFEYLGNEYSDACEIYSKVSVEKIKISDDNLEMKTGSSAKLSAALSPQEATDKDVIWISEDAGIASVSQDGSVTAIGAGTVSIIAVSSDGHFRDSCTVTVID
ncbi:MAG: hypothetical protein GX051_00910 [Clostridiales bacterium]|nr:hypothetical protein [Clostridiales bacterium]